MKKNILNLINIILLTNIFCYSLPTHAMQRTWLKPTLGIATGVGIYTAPYSISERRRRYNELIQRGYTPAQANKMSREIGYWGNFYAGYQRNKIVNKERKRYNKQNLKNNQFHKSKKINKKQ